MKGKVGILGTSYQGWISGGHFSGMCPVEMHGFRPRIRFSLESEKGGRIETIFYFFFLIQEIPGLSGHSSNIVRLFILCIL